MARQATSVCNSSPTATRAPSVCVFAFAVLLVGAFEAQGAPLEVSIINGRGVEVFLSFGGAATIDGQIDGSPLALGTNYSVGANSTRAGIDLTTFNGRIYLSLENALTTPTSGNGFSPNFANPSLGDYGTRWDKAEINVAPGNPFSVINLSAQDFFSVPLEIRTYTSGSTTPATVLTWHENESTVMESLASLAVNEASATNKAIVNGAAGVSTTSHGNVVRMISPATTGGIVTPYSNIGDYVDAMRTAGQQTKIAGTALSQNYDLVASFATVANPMTKAEVGDIVMTGTIGSTPTTIVLPQEFLTSIEIYMANPTEYFVDGVSTAPSNSVYDAAIRDVYVGFNIGAIGSTVENPNVPGTSFGDSTSDEWMKPDKLPFSDLYSHAQPGDPYYNQYAEVVAAAGDAYGFAFSDFVQSPLASLNPSDVVKMEIVVLVPEPPTVLLASLGLAVILLSAWHAGRHSAKVRNAQSRSRDLDGCAGRYLS